MRKKQMIWPLKTPRLILRPLRREDYALWKNAFSSLLPKKNRWDWGPLDEKKLKIANFRKRLEKNQQNLKNSSYSFYVFNKKENQMVGTCYIREVVYGEEQSCVIGYQIFNAFWRQGFGSEVLTALLSVAFDSLKLNRIQAFVSPTNVRSRALLKKFKFTREGIIREKYIWLGRPHDMVLYSLLSRD